MSRHSETLTQREVDKVLSNLDRAGTKAERAARELEKAEQALQRSMAVPPEEAGSPAAFDYRHRESSASGGDMRLQREEEQAKDAHQSAMSEVQQARQAVESMASKVEHNLSSLKEQVRSFQQESRQISSSGVRREMNQISGSLQSDERKLSSWLNRLKQAAKNSGSLGQTRNSGLESRVGGGQGFYPDVSRQLSSTPYSSLSGDQAYNLRNQYQYSGYRVSSTFGKYL